MTQTRRGLLGAGLAMAVAGPALARQTNAVIEAEAANFLATTRSPGLQVAMARHGQLAFVGAWGLSGPGGGPLTHDHRFRIASVSKPITAAAAMRLVEAGRLNLDAAVFGPGSILGESYGPTTGAHRAIRVRHLLNHSVGGWTNDGYDPSMAHPGVSQTELIARGLAERPLNFVPGTTQLYSNFGYLLLGRVIERVTGQPYEAWVRQDVLARCGAGGMRVGESLPGADEVRYRAITIFDDPNLVEVRRLDSAGGWVANARELIGFASAVDGGQGAGRILSPASARFMATAPIAGSTYGHGWRVNQWDTWWHNGILAGTSAFLCRGSSGHTLAALANTGGPGSDVTVRLEQMIWRMAAAVPGWTM